MVGEEKEGRLLERVGSGGENPYSRPKGPETAPDENSATTSDVHREEEKEGDFGREPAAKKSAKNASANEGLAGKN